MNPSQQAIAYYEAIRAGYSPQQAFQMAFPDGLPTQEDRLKEAADAQQEAGYGQIGGILAGMLGTKAVADAVANRPVLGGIFSNAGDKVAGLLGSGGGATEGALGSFAGADAASQAAWNAAASKAGGGLAGVSGGGGSGAAFGGGGHAAGSGTGAGGLSLASTVPYAGAAAGAYLVKEGLEDLVEGKKPSGIKGNASRAQTAITTGYLSEVARALGFGDRETTSQERARRYDALKDAGVLTHWDQGGGDPYAAGGQIRDDLASDFIGVDPEGNWVNNKFAESRDVNDLRAEDIWGHSAFYEKFGNDWLQSFNEDQRRKIAQGLLDQGLVSEGRGQIEINSEMDPMLARQMFLGEQPQAEDMRSGPAQIGSELAASLGFGPGIRAEAPVGSVTPEQAAMLTEGGLSGVKPQRPLTEDEMKQLDRFGSKLVGALY